MMVKAKQMPLGLQARMIRTDLIAAGYEPELSDIRSFMDSSLSYPENRALVARAFGYRIGVGRGGVPKRLDSITTQAGIWNRQQADRRRRSSKPKGTARKQRDTSKLKPLPYWQINPWPLPGDDIDGKRKALPPGRRVSRTGKVYYERRKNRSDMPGTQL